MFDIFNLDNKALSKGLEAKKSNTVLYSPKAKDGNNDEYTAIIRLLPNPTDAVNKSIIPITRYYINSHGLKQYVKTDGSYNNVFSKAYFELRDRAKLGDAIAKKNIDKLRRNIQFYAYAYIVSDDINPENTGKFAIYQFPGEVDDIIRKSTKDTIAAGRVISEGVKPFDVIHGSDLLLSLDVKPGKEKYTSYKNVKFLTPSEMMYKNQRVSEYGMDFQKEFLEFTKANPLEDYGYVPEPEDVMEKVNLFLDSLTGKTTTRDTVTSVNDNPFSNVDDTVEDNDNDGDEDNLTDLLESLS